MGRQEYDDPAVERAECLFSSPLRLRLLEELQDGPRSEAGLCESLDEPQPTINQNVRTLWDLDLLERVDGEYRLTWRGRTTLTTLREYADTQRALDRLEPFLQHVDVKALSVSTLVDAELVTGSPNDPFACLHRAAELLREAEVIRGFSPYLVPQFGHDSADVVADTQVEVVLGAEAVADLPPVAPAALDEATGDADVDLYRTAASLPCALMVLPDRVLLGAFDDSGLPRALLVTDADAARQWATQALRQRRESAEKLTVGQPIPSDD